MRHCKAPSFFICRRRRPKIIAPHVEHCHIVQRHCDRFGILLLMSRKVLVGTLIALQGLGEAILAVKDVAEIQIQAGNAPWIALLREDPARFSRRCKSLPVAALQNKRLNRRTQGACDLFVVA